MGEAQTLVLDIGYQPINRVTLKRAMLLLISGRAEVVSEYDRTIWDKNIANRAEAPRLGRDTRTATEQFRAPSVIRLAHTVPYFASTPRFSRINIWLRDKGACQYCGKKVPLDGEGKFTQDHVIPQCRGGLSGWTNIVTACYKCNQKKGGRTPEEADMRLLSRPVRPKHLPGSTSKRSLYWNKGMPSDWKTWLRDTLYWTDTLENDMGE